MGTRVSPSSVQGTHGRTTCPEMMQAPVLSRDDRDIGWGHRHQKAMTKVKAGILRARLCNTRGMQCRMEEMGTNALETARVVGLYRYPVKGLSPEDMGDASVPTGGTMPADRRYAIENGPGSLRSGCAAAPPEDHVSDADAERAPRRAQDPLFDDAAETLTVERDGKARRLGTAQFQAWTPAHRAVLCGLNAGRPPRSPPRIVEAEGHSFSDSRSEVPATSSTWQACVNSNEQPAAASIRCGSGRM